MVVDESHVIAAADRRDVQRRPRPQGDPRRVRLPAALRARQPPAPVRGVHGAGAADDQRVGHAGRLSSCELSGGVIVEQIIRPTGLVDPVVEIRPVKGQVDDLLHEIRARVARRRAGAGHHAHQADVGRPHRLPAAGRRPGALSPLRHRRDRADRDPPRASASAISTSWWASTCSARGSTCPRCRWWRSSTPTRRASSAPTAR